MNNLYEEMNTFLADQIVLGMKIHNIHWYLVGSGFFPVHEQLDEYYAEAQERVDAVAERLLTIGAQPLGSLQKVLDRTRIKELDDHNITAKEGIEHLIVDFETLNNLALKLVKLAEQEEDPGTADYFTSVSQVLVRTYGCLNHTSNNQ